MRKKWYAGLLALGILLLAAPRVASRDFPLLDLLNGRTNTTQETSLAPVPTAVIVQATATVAPKTPATQAASLPTATAAPSAVPTKDETYTGLDAVVALLQDLQAKRDAVYMQPGSGWWHTVTRTEGFFNTSATFADGSPVPTAYTTEDWDFVDEKGYVSRSVSIQDTGSPATSQIVVFQNGILRDLSTGAVDRQEAGLAQGDSEIQNVQETIRYGGDVQITREVWNGVDVYVLVAYDPFPEGVTMAGVPENSIGMLGKTYYSVQDGHVLAIEVYYQLDDGSTLLDSRKITEVLEAVESPPADVLGYLK